MASCRPEAAEAAMTGINDRFRYERTRTHRTVERSTQPVTFDDFAPVDHWGDGDDWHDVDAWVEPVDDVPPGRRGLGIDPKLLRIGVVAAVGVLMIPIAMAIGNNGGEGSGDGLRGADVAVTAPAPVTAAPAPAVVTVPITAGATVPSTAAPSRVSSGGGGGAAVAAAPAAIAEPVCAGTYTVIFNDFWNRFPKTSGASVEEWLAANNATIDSPLYVGDELCIPAGATAPAPPPTTAAPTTTAPPATTAAPTTAAPTTVPPPPPTTATPVTAAPTTAAPAPAPPPASPSDPASVEAMIREIWPDDLEERALTIAKRESGLRPWINNWCCYGVFAIYFEMGKSWLADLGVTSAQQLYDARTNITAAYHLYTLAGWQPWSQTDPG